MKVKPAIVLVVGCAALITAGCESEQGLDTADWEQQKQLMQEKSDLEARLEKLQAANEQLQEQIKVLSKLPADIDLEQLHDLKRIEITKRTGLYDKDGDGRKEKLIVYLRPVDSEGDAIKVPGSVRVGLWDLSREPQGALLEKWNVEPSQLKKLWLSGMLTHYYRLSFDLSRRIEGTKELTVRVNFTDLITGQVITNQKAIKP